MDTAVIFLHNNVAMKPDLILLHGAHTRDCTANLDKRFDYHTVQLMTRGGVELFYDGQRHELHKSWAWPCHPGPRVRFHAWPRGTAWEHRYVAFTGPRVAAWRSAGLLLSNPQALDSKIARALARRFDELLLQLHRPGPWATRRAGHFLEGILIDCAEARDAASPDTPAWLDLLLERLADFDDEPDYATLAREHGMSLSTLRRRFRDATGQTPHDHRLGLRVAAARQLLGETDLPLKQIADQLGYRDVFYFTRQFTQRTGITPGAVRRARQG